MPFGFLCFALGSGRRSSRCHSFFVGWGSLIRRCTPLVEVRAGEALPCFASSLDYLIRSRSCDHQQNARRDVICCLVALCARGAGSAHPLRSTAPVPQNLLAFGLAEVLRKFCGKSIEPNPACAQPSGQQLICNCRSACGKDGAFEDDGETTVWFAPTSVIAEAEHLSSI